jgi:thiol:disulfide interchange protein DsbD
LHLLKTRTLATITLGLALACSVSTLAATAPATAAVPHGTVTLVSETTSLAPRHETWLGLHFVLEPGWHTYWANPGDSGTPPHLTWKLPAGFQAGPISWAIPERLPLSGGLTDYGYQKDVTLLVSIKGGATASPAPSAEVNVQISIVVCKDLCIPGKANVSVALPVRAAPPVASNANTVLFAAARNRLPKPLPAGWSARATDSKNEFLLTADIGKQATHAFFFPLD